MPEEVDEAGTITTYKIHVDSYMNRKDLGYWRNMGRFDMCR